MGNHTEPMDPLESLKGERISRLGPLTLSAIDSKQTVLDAVRAMQASRVGCAIVCEGGKVAGIITERDILRRLGSSQPLDVPIKEAMSKTVWALGPLDTVGRAMEIMRERQCRHLAVVEADGTPRGVLSVRQVIHALVEHFPAAVYNLPPEPNQVPTAPEGA